MNAVSRGTRGPGPSLTAAAGRYAVSFAVAASELAWPQATDDVELSEGDRRVHCGVEKLAKARCRGMRKALRLP
jgi:hypothetical protein